MKPFRLILARLLARPLPPLVAAHLSQLLYPYDSGWKDRYDFSVRARTGSLYSGATHDMHAHLFAIHGYFDWRLLAAAAYLCRDGDHIVEVGANVGTETVGLADIVGPEGRVYAFEPEPVNRDKLCKTLNVAGLVQVKVIPAAASNVIGTVGFIRPSSEQESGIGRITSTNLEMPDNGHLQVECVTLDAFLADKGPIRLLVIDAEGAEVLILRGAKEVLSRDAPGIIVEAQEHTLRSFGVGLEDLQAELRAYDYKIFELARFGLTKANVQDLRRCRNWLALPPSLADEAKKIHRHLLKCGLFPCLPGFNPLTKRFRQS